MTHINTRYKLIHDTIEHKLREIATHQSISMTYEIKSEWVEMISNALDRNICVSYLLYVFCNRTNSIYNTKFQLMDIREVEMDSTIFCRHLHLMVIQFDKSLFRDLALDSLGV